METRVAAGETGDDAADRQPSPWAGLREWLVIVVIAVTSAFVVRTYVLGQYSIDGQSMQETLHNGDRVLVNKLAYHLHSVNHGDVVVFDRITNDGVQVLHDDLIKRVIAVEGETVEVRDCLVFVDGQEVAEPYLDADAIAADPTGWCGRPNLDPITVPEGDVFVMGDNRPNSQDSRVFGPIDTDLIRGRAFVLVWPVGSWRWL